MSEIVITAGGPREKIDDVRSIGNFSSGRLGHAIARVYAEKKSEEKLRTGASQGLVKLLAPKSTIDRFGEIEGVKHIPFESTRDLRARLLGIHTADVVIHSAAVADYIPEYVYGKIRSDKEELNLRLRRAPKILAELREHFGPDTTLVGFKLLSGEYETVLRQVAEQQIVDNDLDYCIANDLQKITKDSREVDVIQKGKDFRIGGVSVGYIVGTHKGTTDEVAQHIYERITNPTTGDYDIKSWG